MNVFYELRAEKHTRDEKGNVIKEFSQSELAKELGIAQSKISDLEKEKGGKAPSKKELKAYHDYFHCPYEYLFNEPGSSRYYEHQTLASEIGLTGKSIETLKSLFNAYNGQNKGQDSSLYKAGSDEFLPGGVSGIPSEAVTHTTFKNGSVFGRDIDGRILRTVNYLIENNYLLSEIGEYLDSANCEAQYVDLHYTALYEQNGTEKPRDNMFHFLDRKRQNYSKFCEIFLQEINENLRQHWNTLHKRYEKQNTKKGTA